MNLSANYDWIVLADHPGALLSANLAARLGLSVLVLPKSATQKVVFSERGQCLDPESNFIGGLGERGLLEETLRRISALPSDSELNASDPLAQVITPDLRIALPSTREGVLSELKRELPENSLDRELIEHGVRSWKDVQEYWNRFPLRLSLELGENKKLPRQAPASWDDLLRRLHSRKLSASGSDLLLGLGYAVSGQSPEGWSVAEWAHALALGQSGASFRGGVSAYRRALLRSAKKLGATVLEDAECRRIFVENRRFVGIQVSISANMVAGTGCMLGSTISEFADRISYTGTRWGRKPRNLPRALGWRFTIALTVHEDAIGPGTSRRMIWKEKNSPYLEIEIADPTDYGTQESDRKLVFLRTVLPFTQESLGIASLRMTAARMFRMATEIMPFLEYHVIRVYPDFRSADATAGRSLDSKDELSEIYGFAMPQMIPENLRVYEASSVRVSTGIEGLFISAGQCFPKLGSLGPTVAALEATAWLAHRSGLPGPFAF